MNVVQDLTDLKDTEKQKATIEATVEETIAKKLQEAEAAKQE